MSVLIFSSTEPDTFGPETTSAMSEAYEAALEELRDTGQPQIVRDIIAERIVAAAKLGELDPVRLREAALGSLLGKED
jgi:hypothetical protein